MTELKYTIKIYATNPGFELCINNILYGKVTDIQVAVAKIYDVLVLQPKTKQTKQ